MKAVKQVIIVNNNRVLWNIEFKISFLVYGSKIVAGPGIGVQLPEYTNTRQLGSFDASPSVKVVDKVVVRVDQLPFLFCLCTL